MSNPPNKLSTFRSYSYYHVLAMCDCSETANALSQSVDSSAWDHATPDTRIQDQRTQLSDLGRYSPKEVTNGGRYCILINGSTDAAFVINQVRWLTATGASAVPGDRGASLAVEGSLQVSEPKGVAFLDQVIKCCTALGVDSAHVKYVLKTFFVGIKDDATSTSSVEEFIGDIPPLVFMTYDVTGSFTEAGGMYEMLFVGAGHGVSRLPQYSKVTNSMHFTSAPTLAGTLQRLSDSINANYTKYFDCVFEQIRAANGDSAPILAALRRVKYVIEVGPEYQDAKYTVTNQSQQFKNTAGCDDPVQLSFPPHTSIETAIGTIMNLSPRVQADMAVGDSSTNIKYEYKIHTAFVSERGSDSEEGIILYTVYYRVERFMSPKTISYNPAFAVLQKDDEELRKDPEYEKIRRNIIEFDYLYTGKNTDILEFDMKVNMGMAYLQTATLANTFKSQIERAPNRVMQPASTDVNNHMVRLGSIVQTPVFFGTQIKTPHLTNTQNSGHAIQSAYTLTKHSSLEVTDVTMRVIGNTQLLGTANKLTSPTFIVESATRSTSYTPVNSNQANFNDWFFAPSYAKVKIMMPRENDDFALFTGQSTTGDPRTDPGITDYARDFWFDGYYYVVGVEHIFEGGEFSQILTMLGLPKRSAFESTKNAATQDVNIGTSVGSCFDNQIIIPSSTSSTEKSAIAVPHTPPAGDTTPTNAADAASANRTATSVSDVKGWDKASPAVKTAILDAANRFGVDPVVMAQIAAKESSFNPTAKAKTSSATGLYQFIKSTWNGLVDEGKIPGVTSGSPDLRLDPLYNAYGGAVYLRENARTIGSGNVGDLYLAHFLGPGTAKKVIRSDEASGGKELLLTAIGTSATLKIAKANPSIVRPNTTVGEIRTWAAISMSKTLINPVATARQSSPVVPSSVSGATLPSKSPELAGRTADKSIAAVQNAKVQGGKNDTTLCGPSPQSKT